MKTIGIIGAGRIAGAFTRQLIKSEFKAVISNSRGTSSLKTLVRNFNLTLALQLKCFDIKLLGYGQGFSQKGIP